MTRIIQISDTHIVAPGALAYGVVDTAAGLRRAMAWLSEMRSLLDPLDAVFFSGDLVDLGQAEEYAHFTRLIEPLDWPWLAVPGNHDHRETMRHAWAGRPWMPPSGPINMAQHFGEIQLIGLDSQVPGAPYGELDSSTLAFLDQALAAAPDRPALVGLHHPPCATGILPMDRQALRNPQPLLRRLAAHPSEVRLVCGHIHRAISVSIDGIVCQMAPAPSHAVALDFRPDNSNALWLEPGAILLHEWRDGRFISHVIPTARASGPFCFAS